MEKYQVGQKDYKKWNFYVAKNLYAVVEFRMTLNDADRRIIKGIKEL